MFSYIRVFCIFSFILIVAAAYSVGLYYKHIAGNDLVEMVEINASAVTDSYVHSVWEKHRPTLVRLSRISVDKWQNYREFQEFRRDTIAFFENMPVNQMRILLPTGVSILNTDPAGVNGMQVLDAKVWPFSHAVAGHGEVDLKVQQQYKLPNGDMREGTLVEAYLPIFMKDYVKILADDQSTKVEAVVFIQYDISAQWVKLTSFQYIAVVGIVAIFLMLLIMLVFFSRRAETIIARQHEINLELTAAAAAAESENRDKSMFLANISHELRTPLNAIIGFSEILSNDLASILEMQHRDYIRDINQSGKHLLSLINDILEFSKAEAGKLEVDLSEIDGTKMVKNSIRLMVPRAEEAQVTLLEDLPKKPFILHTDAKKLKQILLNLLSNAVKFTPPNGQVKVTAWHDTVRDKAIFVVSDTGIGIAPKDISKVMTPFGQVESHLSRRYEGTGLGLPLSKKLVELLGGTFSIESEVNVGTTITLEFPMTLKREKVSG
jgi:two-component system, cell cycle sensor histidine kinase PleC